jgi:Ca-activated chloride channel homolog
MNLEDFVMRMLNRLAVGALALVLMPVAFAGPVQVKAELGTPGVLGIPVVLPGETHTTYLRVAMTGEAIKDAADRAPVNVAFVIDKSGSMGGDKIAHAKDAVIMAIGKLREDDIVSLAAYDDGVRVLVPATRLTDKDSVVRAVRELDANGSTALFAGVSKGAAELRKFIEKERVNRIVLLSDGIANVGPSSPGDLQELGTSLGREGIAVSTIGLGLDYNEDLMTKLAMASDGNHMFAENAGDLESAFAKEFGDVLAVVAQDLAVTIRCADGIRPQRVLGREAHIAGQTMLLSMNQIYGDQTKYVILEVEVPAGKAGTSRDVAVVDVDFFDMATEKTNNLNYDVALRYTDEASEVERETNAEVMADAVYQIGVEENILATRLRDEGNVDEAKEVLERNVLFLRSNADKYGRGFAGAALNSFATSNEIAAENLDDENWKRQRKIMRYEQHEIITQQKVTAPDEN